MTISAFVADVRQSISRADRSFLTFHASSGMRAVRLPVGYELLATYAPCSGKPVGSADGTIIKQSGNCSTTRIHNTDVLSAVKEDASPKKIAATGPPPAPAATEVKPEPLPADESDPQLRAKYVAATAAYYDYYTRGYAHRQRVFGWQLISSEIIFVLVVLLVASGVYFAALQFHEGRRQRANFVGVEDLGKFPTTDASNAASASRQATLEGSSVTTFSASGTGISVSSPVLGVVILVISLAFFYLYLVYVYPITELF